MKYFSVKQTLITSLILIYFQIINANKTKNRFRFKSKIRNVLKSKNTKKDGPLVWDILTEDKTLEGILKNERYFLNDSTNANDPPLTIVNNVNTIKNNNEKQTQQQNINELPIFLGGNVPLSENQKSKTFRPVGPFEDSTVNWKGKKYSKMYKVENRNISPGFYGRSRLTRF